MPVSAVLQSNLVQEPCDAALLLLCPAEKHHIAVCTDSVQYNCTICNNGLRGKLGDKGFRGLLQQSQLAQSLTGAAAYSADAEYQKSFA